MNNVTTWQVALQFRDGNTNIRNVYVCVCLCVFVQLRITVNHINTVMVAILFYCKFMSVTAIYIVRTSF
jgi:hypothetical protein